MDACPGGEDEGDMRPVDHEASGALARAALQELRDFNVARRRVEHRKDGSDSDIGVNVRGAVERINRHEQRPVAIDRNGTVALLGNDAADARAIQPIDKGLVGKHVERLLGDSIVRRADCGVEGAAEQAAADDTCDGQRGLGQGVQNGAKFSGGVCAEERLKSKALSRGVHAYVPPGWAEPPHRAPFIRTIAHQRELN